MASNKNIILIMGTPNSGKSTSLRNMQQDNMVYLNTDLKEIPFVDNFMKTLELKDAAHLTGFIQRIEQQDKVGTVVLDTLTFAMDMFERQYVLPHAGTSKGQTAWSEYAQYYGNFIHALKAGTKDYIIMAHDAAKMNEDTMEVESSIPIKGAVGKRGAEADFTIILAAKRISLKQIPDNVKGNPLLNITEEEEEDGEKYVFQTRPFKGTGSKCRGPIGLWDRSMLYIDNDAAAVMNHVKAYYGSK